MSIRSTLTIFGVSASLFLGGCSIYHMPIQQGNVLTSSMAKGVHKGMTRHQVVAKIGSPVMITPFKSHELTYIYTLRPTKGLSLYKRFRVTFRKGRVSQTAFTQH